MFAQYNLGRDLGPVVLADFRLTAGAEQDGVGLIRFLECLLRWVAAKRLITHRTCRQGFGREGKGYGFSSSYASTTRQASITLTPIPSLGSTAMRNASLLTT